MNSKRLRLLIVGIALLVLSPAVGWLLTFVGFMRTNQEILDHPPGTLEGLFLIPSRLYANFAIVLVGGVFAAVGLFLILYVFVMHIWGPKPALPNTNQGGGSPPSHSAARPVSIPVEPALQTTLKLESAQRTPFSKDPYADKTPMEKAWEELNKPAPEKPHDDSRYMPKQ